MLSSRTTLGWEKYEAFVLALQTAGVTVVEGKKEDSLIRGPAEVHNCYCDYLSESEGRQVTCPCCEEKCDHIQQLRVACFNDQKSGKLMVVEEVLEHWAQADDSDDFNVIGIKVHPCVPDLSHSDKPKTSKEEIELLA